MAHTAKDSWGWPGARTRIVDRRGQTLLLCEPDDVPHEAPASVREAVAAANRSRWSTVARSAFISTALLALWWAFRVWRYGMNATLGSVASTGATLVAAGAIGVMLDDLNAPSRGRRALMECLRGHRCPSCCYDLCGTQPGADTLVRCPECGGAWPGPDSVDSPVPGAET
jgi:hypothetical protein